MLGICQSNCQSLSWPCMFLQTHKYGLTLLVFFLKVNFRIACCDNALLMVLSGLGIKTTDLGSWKDPVLALLWGGTNTAGHVFHSRISELFCYKHNWKSSRGLLKHIQWLHTWNTHVDRLKLALFSHNSTTNPSISWYEGQVINM